MGDVNTSGLVSFVVALTYCSNIPYNIIYDILYIYKYIYIHIYIYSIVGYIQAVAAPVPGTDSKSNGVFYHFIHNS